MVELITWRAATKKYLSARSTFQCSSLMYRGKRMRPQELPEAHVERLRKIVAEFKCPAEEVRHE